MVSELRIHTLMWLVMGVGVGFLGGREAARVGVIIGFSVVAYFVVVDLWAHGVIS